MKNEKRFMAKCEHEEKWFVTHEECNEFRLSLRKSCGCVGSCIDMFASDSDAGVGNGRMSY